MAKSLAGVVALLAGLGSPASAALAEEDDGLIFDIAATEACLATARGTARRDCIGASAGACMEANMLGATTVGMAGCADKELSWWDARLNSAYAALMAHERKADAEFAAPYAPSRAEALRDMQRAWIVWRDATCAYERSLWGGGSGGGPATVMCVLHLTAEQTFYLQDQLASDF